MNPSEIRFGNLLCEQKCGDVFRFTPEYCSYVFGHEDDHEGVLIEEYYSMVGMVKTGSNYVIERDGVGLVIMNGSAIVSRFGESVILPNKFIYVHQVQNLWYDITGEEI